jgi:hypothetical protein
MRYRFVEHPGETTFVWQPAASTIRHTPPRTAGKAGGFARTLFL